jgi:TPR repeat protein
MSAPVRESDDGPSKDGPLNYAPKKVRQPEPDPTPAGSLREGDAAPRQGAPESGQPPWKRSKRHGPFAGDVAIVELRNKLALAPYRLPEPPPSTGVKFGLASRLAGVAVVTAVGVIGYRLGSAPQTSPPQLALHSSQSNQQGSAPERSVSAAYPIQSAAPPFTSPAAAKAIVPQSDEQKSGDAASSRASFARLTVGAVQPQQVDEAARLAVSAADASADAAVVIGGLAPGLMLSTGTQVGPNTWRLSVEELTGAAIKPPRGFVGATDLTLELRLADNTVVDRKSLRLEWSDNGALARAKSQPRRFATSELALMVKNGTEYMANGNIGAARMMLQPAAEAGDAVAAFALAETYDPLVLRKRNVKGGITADVSLAQTWYQKAMDLGSAVAPERLERLARLSE